MCASVSVCVCVCVYVCFRDEHNDILAVADWGQKLSFYQLSGKQVGVCVCVCNMFLLCCDNTNDLAKLMPKRDCVDIHQTLIK